MRKEIKINRRFNICVLKHSNPRYYNMEQKVTLNEQRPILSLSFAIVFIVLGFLMSTSCACIEMVTNGNDWPIGTIDTIAYDSNNQPIILHGDVDGPEWIPFFSTAERIWAFFEETPQKRYVNNHYEYSLFIHSDSTEAITLESVRVQNGRGKDIPFHVVDWVPRGWDGCPIDTTIPNGMDTLSLLPCTVNTKYGIYNKNSKALMLRIIVDRHRWLVNRLDFNFCLSVRGQQKRYQTHHRKKLQISLFPHP